MGEHSLPKEYFSMEIFDLASNAVLQQWAGSVKAPTLMIWSGGPVVQSSQWMTHFSQRI
jgi:hypothetical protein